MLPKAKDQTTIKKFTADYCGPCKALEVTLTSVEETYDIEIERVDIQNPENVEQASQYGIRAIPTLVITDKDTGLLIDTASGLLTEAELITFLKENIDI